MATQSNTSPSKQGVSGRNADDYRASMKEVVDAVINRNFTSCYLNRHPKELSESSMKHIQPLLEFVIAQSSEALMYETMVEVLESLNGLVRKSMKEPKPPAFTIHYTNEFTIRGELEHRLKPDIVVSRPGNTVNGEPHYWWNVASCIEAKVGKDAAWQAAHYASVLPKARPDCLGFLYMTFRKQYFRLHWMDASGVVASDALGWDFTSENRSQNCIYILYDFLHTLYKPHHQLPQLDSNFGLVPPTNGDTEPSWMYRTWKFRKTVGHPGPGRQTCILRHLRSAKHVAKGARGSSRWKHAKTLRGARPPRTLKSYWRHLSHKRRFREEHIYAKVHRKGIVPGVVVFGGHEMPEVQGAPIVTCDHMSLLDDADAKSAQKTLVQREKIVLSMRSTGAELSTRKSVLHLLMAMYDLCQAHRLCVAQNVLHRDISDGNVLLTPEHELLDHEEYIEMPPGVHFINRVLDPDADEYKTESELLDFDNAAELDILDSTEPRQSRTGTHKFIALAVGAMDYEDIPPFISPLPEVRGRAKALYDAAFGDADAKWHAIWDTRPADPFTLTLPETFTHHPCYDVQSMVWLLIWELIRAIPEDATDAEQDSEDFRDVYNIIVDHNFGGNRTDSRTGLARDSPKKWDRRVHSGLKDVLPLIHELRMHLFKPELGYYQEHFKDHRDHAHEVFTRILLKYIVLLEETPIRLRNVYRKPAPVADVIAVSISRATASRSVPVSVDEDGRSTKKQRARVA